LTQRAFFAIEPPKIETAREHCGSAAMIDHTGIGVADVGRSAAFYDAILSSGSIGSIRTRSSNIRPLPPATALEAGGTDNGAPGQRRPNYYAAFVLDPDGNNIEAVFRGE
jgi:hypothetical protein